MVIKHHPKCSPSCSIANLLFLPFLQVLGIWASLALCEQVLAMVSFILSSMDWISSPGPSLSLQVVSKLKSRKTIPECAISTRVSSLASVSSFLGLSFIGCLLSGILDFHNSAKPYQSHRTWLYCYTLHEMFLNSLAASSLYPSTWPP